MKEELKRFFKKPLFYIFLCGCMVINLWILWNHSSERSLVKASAAVADQGIGGDRMVYVTEETIRELYLSLQSAINEDSGEYTELCLRTLLKGTLSLAKDVSPSDLAAGFITSAGLFGGGAQKAREICEGLLGIFERIKESGIASRFFVPGHHGFFDMYCKELIPAMSIEGIVVCVLLMLRTANDAFSSGTYSLVFTTKKGRKSQWSRFAAGMLGAAAFTAMLWGLCLGAAALWFPLGSLWNTPLGSCMILSNLFPVIGRIPMTVLGYMGVELFVALCLNLLFAAAAFGLAQWRHHSFRAVLIMGFFSMLISLVTSLTKGLGAYFVLAHNPVDMAQRAGFWLASGIAWVAPDNYELITLMLWGILTAVLVFIMTRKFYREDLI